MGRKYHKPHKIRHGGKAGMIAALLGAFLGRGRSGASHYRPHPPSLKGSILRFILGRLFKRH